MSGCSLAPDYHKPAAPVPNQWPQGEAYEDLSGAPGPTVVPDLKWREFITDAKLRTIIETALANNRDLRLAALNVEKARAMYGIQRAELFPAVNAGAEGGKERSSRDLTEPGKPLTSEHYGLTVGITSWELDLFGRIRSLKDQALEEYLATDQARRGARISLVSEVARVYLTLAADREIYKLAQSTLEAQKSSYSLVRKRYDAGVATELDLRRAETPMETAKVDIARYRQLVAQDLNSLNLLVGAPTPQDLLPSDLAGTARPKKISPGLSSEVLLRRPDIMAAEHRLKGAYAYVGAARAAFFPRIALTTTIGTASNDLGGLFGSGTGTWSFLPQISMPIFDPRTWAALEVSEADQKIILTQYEKTIQTAFREVADALALQGNIDQQVAAQKSLVKAVAATYRLSTERYENGIDSYLGVLDAQRSLFSAQQALVSLRLSKRANQVNIYAVLGGGGN